MPSCKHGRSLHFHLIKKRHSLFDCTSPLIFHEEKRRKKLCGWEGRKARGRTEDVPGMITAYSWGQEDFEAEDKDGESSAQGLADVVL